MFHNRYYLDCNQTNCEPIPHISRSFIDLCCLPGVAFGLEVRQSRSDITVTPGEKVHIFCTHEKTDFWVMLWYRQPPADTALKLIGHLYTSDIKMEDEDDRNVQIAGDLSGSTAKNSSLVINVADPKHTAVYYCAAREAH